MQAMIIISLPSQMLVFVWFPSSKGVIANKVIQRVALLDPLETDVPTRTREMQ